MNTKSTIDHRGNRAAFERAIVIGSSIAGLTTARVLADYFAQVTLIERDRLPDTPEFRRGAPQAHHSHLLLAPGQSILEQQFPGLRAELMAKGAIWIDKDLEMEEAPDGVLFNNITGLSGSRPLLEHTIYRRLAVHPKVQILQGLEVSDLLVNRQRQSVAGVHVRNGSGLRSEAFDLPAGLIVDTTGRGSKAPRWLANWGYTPPTETVVDAFSGYASRIYRRLPGQSWKLMRIERIPPDRRRGGLIIPLEGDRWHVTLVGTGRDYPASDEAGFLAFARSLPSQQLYRLIKEARPLNEIYSFRGAQNRLRHYDKLPRYLEGFLVSGDAVCAVSPVHAMGMTAAAIAGQTLAACLTEQQQRGNLSGLARAFQQQLRRDIDPVWQKVTSSDRAWPATEVVHNMITAKQPRSRMITTVIHTPIQYGPAYR